jgi:hypothetical protein
MPKFEWDKVIKNGIFAVLFVSLLYYVVTRNDERETRYINMIDTLNETINVKLVELKAMHQRS